IKTVKTTLMPPEAAVELYSDLTDMHRNPRRLTDSDRDGIELKLPDDVALQYLFRDSDGNPLVDEDQATVRNVWYGTLNLIEGPDYRPDRLNVESREARAAGSFPRTRFESVAMNEERRLNSYTPAG